MKLNCFKICKEMKDEKKKNNHWIFYGDTWNDISLVNSCYLLEEFHIEVKEHNYQYGNIECNQISCQIKKLFNLLLK